MGTTQYIREQLGLTQETLAMYLLIPLSQLAMHETGKRELPAKASVKIAELLTLLNQIEKNSKARKEFTKEELLAVDKQLHSQIIKLEYQLAKEKRKLEVLKKKLEQNRKLKGVLSLLSENKNKASEMLQFSKTSIEKSTITIQTNQLVKIEGIQSQLESAKKLIDTKI